MKQTTDEKIDALTATVTTLAATVDTVAKAVDRGFSAVAEDITEIKENMAELSEKGDNNHVELRGKFEGLEKRLDMEVERRAKERLPERVRAIEQHLGIEKQILA